LHPQCFLYYVDYNTYFPLNGKQKYEEKRRNFRGISRLNKMNKYDLSLSPLQLMIFDERHLLNAFTATSLKENLAKIAVKSWK